MSNNGNVANDLNKVRRVRNRISEKGLPYEMATIRNRNLTPPAKNRNRGKDAPRSGRPRAGNTFENREIVDTDIFRI